MGQQRQRDIAAGAETVWAAVSDITRMGEWSTETYKCYWNEGQTPGVGATFTGRNRYRDTKWANIGTITDWVPNERIAWDVSLIGEVAERFGTGPMTTWGFALESIEGGTRLTQFTEDMRPDELKEIGAKFLPEIADRIRRNEETMDATLAAIALACES